MLPFEIPFKDIRYIVLIVLLGYGYYLFQENERLQEENSRVITNYETALKLDSLKVAVFKVKKQNELDELILNNKGLSSLVNQTKIKKKRIQNLYYQQQKYVDSVKKKMDVTGLVASIRKDIPATLKWKDSSDCLTIKGNVNYNKDSLSVSVSEKEFNNNIILVKHKGRRNKVKWLLNLRLGKRPLNFTQQSKCGKGKVTIIEKE